MHITPTALRRLSAALILSAIIPAGAQAQNTSMDGIITFGGQMQALAEKCGDYNATDLTKMKAKQKEHAELSGVSGTHFDTVFQTGYENGLTTYNSATPADQQQACEQARALAKMQVPGTN